MVMDTIGQTVGETLVWENRALTLDTFLMTIKAPQGFTAEAGQCVKLRAWAAPEEGGTPLLDRPFSIHALDGNELSVLYRVVGPGTRALSGARPGDRVKLSGPFGRGLEAAWNEGGEAAPSRLYLVGGGIGLAPMRFVLSRFAGEAKLFYGERGGAQQLPQDWLAAWAKDYAAVTESGDGYGEKGLVTAPLAAALKAEKRPVFACGPGPMMAAVLRVCEEHGVEAWVSMEARMACGFGICLTCSLPLKNGGRFRACQEGPVFDGRLIDWGRVK